MDQALRNFGLKCRAYFGFALLTFLLWGWVGPGINIRAGGLDGRTDLDERLTQAFALLENIPDGKILIEKARKTWKLNQDSDLISHFKWGSASRTDTILTRHFNTKTSLEEREREVTIFLRKDQSEGELILDMAHELVHATSRPSFDPYDPSLSVGRYIQAAIDGEGGEVDAVLVECTIGMELEDHFKLSLQRCQNYSVLKGPGPKLSRAQISRDFYRVGHWFDEVKKNVGSELNLFPFLTDIAPRLFSSTGHAPYPIALLREYEELTSVACKNSIERKKSLAVRSTSPVETQARDPFLSNRCHYLEP